MAYFVQGVACDLSVESYLGVDYLGTMVANTGDRREKENDPQTWCVDRESGVAQPK